jgi:hypothetical protein
MVVWSILSYQEEFVKSGSEFGAGIYQEYSIFYLVNYVRSCRDGFIVRGIIRGAALF